MRLSYTSLNRSPTSLAYLINSVASFSPISLFSAGEQGIWLDPSDLTTMFQDRAGTTPVTTPGQTVGLRLDKSKGLVLGSELITNGDFSNGLTGWVNGGGWVADNNTAKHPFTATDRSLLQGAAIAGKSYLITYDVVNYIVGGSMYVACGGVAGVSANRTNGSYREIITATGTGAFGIVAGGTWQGSIDNFSVKELLGNHAVAPTDAARPTYGIEPKTGRRNLLTRTEEFGDAAWTKAGLNAFGSGSVANTTATTDPVGGNTAEYIQENSASGDHTAYVAMNLTAAPHTFTVYCKAAQRTWVYVRLAKAVGQGAYFNLSTGTIGTVETGITAAITSVGNGWYRCSVTITTDTTPWYPTIVIATGDNQGAYTGNGTSGIYIWGAQLELGSTATDYQRVGTAFDVTEAGVATVHYVQYDGTDDSFSTSSINFSATDKMSVFAGVRKLSNAAGIVTELGYNFSSVFGAFGLFVEGSGGAANTAANNYAFGSNGTVVSLAVAAPFVAPISNVVTSLGDISGDLATIRVNGTQSAQSTTNQGTGNYGNYPLFIGRRNNATFPFNGRDYGIIVVGKAASASEITATESWLAAKTSGVTL